MDFIFHEFYAQPMDRVYFETISMYIIWLTIMILLKHKSRRVLGCIGLVLSIVLIVLFTIHGRAIGDKQELCLIPFATFINAKTLPELYRTMYMNMLLFLPLGLSLPFALPDKFKHKSLITVCAGFVFSVVLEVLQYILSIGKCETDDVIMNTLGVGIGATAYSIISKLNKYEECDKYIVIKIKYYLISLIPLLAFAGFLDFKICNSNISWEVLFSDLLKNSFSMTCFIFILMGLLFLPNQFYSFKGSPKIGIRITNLKNANYEYLVFLTTYVFPLVCFNFENGKYKSVFLVLLTLMAIIYVKMDLYIANPIFAVIGYRLFIIDTPNQKGITVFTKEKLKIDDFVEWIPLDESCWYVLRKTNGYKDYKK